MTIVYNLNLLTFPKLGNLLNLKKTSLSYSQLNGKAESAVKIAKIIMKRQERSMVVYTLLA